jgi:hypothetical protein
VADVAFVAFAVAFFAVAAGLVMGCDRIIGSDAAIPVARDEAGDEATP